MPITLLSHTHYCNVGFKESGRGVLLFIMNTIKHRSRSLLSMSFLYSCKTVVYSLIRLQGTSVHKFAIVGIFRIKKQTCLLVYVDICILIGKSLNHFFML